MRKKTDAEGVQTTDAELRDGKAAMDAACLIDQSGRVIAADSTLRSWLADASESCPALDELPLERPIAGVLSQIWGGAELLDVRASIESLTPIAGEFVIRAKRLDGANGSVVHLTFMPPRAEATQFAADALTGLPDRRALAQRVAEWLRATGPLRPRFSLLFMDLDNFKRVNDQYGHGVGDIVLREVCQRWLACVREDDLIVRYGGDEFCALLRDAFDSREVEPVVQRLRTAAQRPLCVGDVELSVSVTIGRSASAGDQVDGPSLEELIEAADRDMYARKRDQSSNREGETP